jgi:hypothetical protein
MMNYAALFRYCQANFSNQWRQFLQEIQNVSIEPAVETPTVMYPRGNAFLDSLLEARANRPPVIARIPDVTFPEDGQYILALDEFVNDENDADSLMSWSIKILAPGSNAALKKPVYRTLSKVMRSSGVQKNGAEYSPSDAVLKRFDTSRSLTARLSNNKANAVDGLKAELNNQTRKVTFSATPDFFTTSPIRVILSAADPGGLSDSTEISVSITPVNDPPKVSGMPDVIFRSDTTSTLALDAFVTDVDNKAEEMSWQASIGTDSVSVAIDAATRIATFRSIRGYAKQNIPAYFTASDPERLSDTDTISVTVSQFTAVDDAPLALPTEFALEQNFPNPFNWGTRLQYAIPSPSHIRITVFDIRGRALGVLIDETVAAGSHSIMWDGKDEAGKPAASGIYYYVLEATRNGQTVFVDKKKLILIK